MNRVFLFDVYGIILGRTDYESIYDYLKPEVSLDEFIYLLRDSDYAKKVELGLISMNDFIEWFLNSVHSDLSVENMICAYKNAKVNYYSDTVDLIHLLKSKGYKVGILSNLRTLSLDHLKSVVDLNDIDYQFYSCYMHNAKPNKSIYESVIKTIDLNRHRIYFFDDTKENCDKASECGLIGIHTTGKNIKADLDKLLEKEGMIL